MDDYCIWIVSPPGYVHSHAFDEVAISLGSAFRALGYPVPIVYDFEHITDSPIILGGNLISSKDIFRLPQNSVIYNLEQIQTGSPWINEHYLNLLSLYEVWDYSKKNIAELAKLGILNVKFCGLGYVPELTTIQTVEPDIDILWYGSLNQRRIDVLQELHSNGLIVKSLFGVYGKERDAYIARSKIILNIHFYEAKVLEIVRILYLLANRRFVISERGRDPDLERPISGGLVIDDYENLVDRCLYYLAKDELRNTIAEEGFARVALLNQVEFIKAVLNNNDRQHSSLDKQLKKRSEEAGS